MPDPHEEAVSAAAHELYAAGPWGTDATLIDSGARCLTDSHSMDTYRAQVRLVAPFLQQERPDPDLVAGTDELVNALGLQVNEAAWHRYYLVLERALGAATAVQPNPPSRAGEVAEELRRLADSFEEDEDDYFTTPRTLRRLADKLTEQEPSRERLAIAFRDWVHESPLSQCNTGADTCPDWPLAYELADVAVGALSEKGRDG